MNCGVTGEYSGSSGELPMKVTLSQGVGKSRRRKECLGNFDEVKKWIN